MDLVFVANYNLRPCKAQYLWWYLVMLEKFPEALFVVTEEYLNVDPNRWELKRMKEINPKFVFEKPKNYVLIDKPEDWPVLKDIKNPADIFRKCTKENIWYLHTFLEDIIEKYDIKTAYSTCNNWTLYSTCLDYKIPVLHQEVGPLRYPYFYDTAYLDFMGVNGNTEFFYRFDKFKEFRKEVKLYSREELLRIVTKPEHYSYVKNLLEAKPTYDCGAALQVDVDSNTIAFNEGWTTADLINKAIKDYGRVLVRNHPSASIHFTNPKSLGGGVLDNSKDSLEFISKCKKIMTINSSVGFQAILMGKEVEILGDNPFREVPVMSEEDKLLALNFAIFSYLVPSDIFGNKEYYEFRKLERNEKILYNKGMELTLKGKK
jgi:hypothetical protein